MHGVAEKYEFYPEIISAMRDGDATVELRKRFMLKAIDETWVTVIEDSIQALDEIIRKPGRFIEENEEVLPIELSRHISSRSIKHLAQHTDYISDVDGDKITPSKILNVFYDETMMTYENKFINTLINRLYGFVSRRYTTALEQGKDEKTTSLDVDQTFSHGEVTGKIKFHMEVSEEPKEGDVVKNYTYTTDLWQRVIRLNNITRAYVNSDFAKNMGKTFIRPPVMRTNPILKNRNLRQCLALWEFIESYERTGLELLVHEDLETLDARYVEELYANSALQYSIFRYQVRNAFEPDKTLAQADSEAPLTPVIQEELVPTESSEFDRTFETEIPLATDLLTKRLTAHDWDLLEAIEISLEAVGFPPHPLNRDQDPEPDLEDFREKPEDATAPEPEPEPIPEPEPVEIIKEVPVEVIKEVPVEVVKEIRVPQRVEQQSVRLSADQWKDLMIGNLLHAGIFASIATIAAAVAVGGLDEDAGKAMLLTEARKAIKPAPELPRVIPQAILPVPDMDLYPLYYIKVKAKQMLDSAALFGAAALHSTKQKAEQEEPAKKKVESVKATPRKAEHPAVRKPIIHQEPLKNPGIELKKQILDASREPLRKCGGFLRKKASDVAQTAVFGMILFDKLTAPKSQKPKKKR